MAIKMTKKSSPAVDPEIFRKNFRAWTKVIFVHFGYIQFIKTEDKSCNHYLFKTLKRNDKYNYRRKNSGKCQNLQFNKCSSISQQIHSLFADDLALELLEFPVEPSTTTIFRSSQFGFSYPKLQMHVEFPLYGCISQPFPWHISSAVQFAVKIAQQ